MAAAHQQSAAADPRPDSRREKVPEDGEAATSPVSGTTQDGDESNSDMARRDELVTELARRYSHLSQQTSGPHGGNPFFDKDEQSPLNPHSANFNPRKWAKALVELDTTGKRTAGVCFQNLSVHGFGTATDYQTDVGNIIFDVIGAAQKMMGISSERKIDILRDFNGLVRAGEMLVVLGPPGSGCSTFLKTVAGETSGIFIDEHSYFNYQGVSKAEMDTVHRGEAIYAAETDVHFPMLSVGDTLTFAARARAPRQLPGGVDVGTYTSHLRDVVMAMYGISHTVNTQVGNEFIRGVSGGERKRVTIAEAALSRAPVQCWDNSTRGLDSANAVEFCKTLRMGCDMFQSTACVSIYQSPQSAYDLFDKALVLYDGRQIFFGPANEARQYFEQLGFECPARQTTPDFLTSMTSSLERVVRPGFEGRAPRTPDEFAAAWKNSTAYQKLQAEIEAYKQEHPLDGPDAAAFRDARRAMQAKQQRPESPFTLSYLQQIQLCLWRAYRRLARDPALTVGMLIGNCIIAIILGTVFLNLPQTTASFYQRGSLIFFACLMNAFSSALEILTLYSQRPIVEKQTRYALYHASADAVASMLVDLPYKVINSITFNLILYFMTNLRREAGAFFMFVFVNFLVVMSMSMIFRTIGSASRTLSQAMIPAAILILALVTFTGFVVPIDYMLGWCRWINYVDPLAYVFETLMVNEFHGREFSCSVYIPNAFADPKYEGLTGTNRVCATVSSAPGATSVNGDAYLETAFRYYNSHRWRNVGITIGFIFAFLCTYLCAAEFVAAKKSKGEVLVFRRGYRPAQFKERKMDDCEHGGGEMMRVGPSATHTSRADGAGAIQGSESIFHWNNVCYDIKIKGEPRRILDHVDGWVKPGTLTALMGVSGAGKTTLLDALASRITMGVITGEMLIDGRLRDTSFQRKTGYVQQQDLHLATTTVREALNFSALLRQPANVSRAEKLAYVDEVIKLLDMREYADAVVGVLGEGLNVEQRKRLTIGVELAAKPPLLLFVDEPTSGLDSQTSWAILDLLEKLTKAGQAILCTIHQPSAMLFQRFDRLLFLAKGGRTVYFGDIGRNSKTLTSYFERHGAPACPDDANPAEWMLHAIGAAPGSHTDIDWHQTWRNSEEYRSVQNELQQLKIDAASRPPPEDDDEGGSYREFAAPPVQQFLIVAQRVFSQYWRTPAYIYSKLTLCTLVSLFVGFTFYKMPRTMQGLQNQMFAIFQLLTVFGQLVQQTMPHFVTQRTMFESRERPSKVYFMLSQIAVEIPWNALCATIMFFGWYYPIGYQYNAVDAGQLSERSALMFLLMLAFLIFICTFTDMMIAGFETAEAGGNLANVCFMMCLIFCGVLASPDALPRFWMFMYRVSPFTYLVSAMLSVGLANTSVRCADSEYVTVDPVNGTCGQYFAEYVSKAGGYVLNTEDSTGCRYCSMGDTNSFLSTLRISYGDRWRNFGLLWVYIIFNILGALVIYWLVREPKATKEILIPGKLATDENKTEHSGAEDTVVVGGEKEVVVNGSQLNT